MKMKHAIQYKLKCRIPIRIVDGILFVMLIYHIQKQNIMMYSHSKQDTKQNKIRRKLEKIKRYLLCNKLSTNTDNIRMHAQRV